MATNAAKYGALSVAEGRLHVSWTLDADKLRLTWQESNGPKVLRPAKTGFGTKVIDASIKRQLGGTIDQAWSDDGLSAVFTAPAEHFSPPAQGERQVKPVSADAPHAAETPMIAGRRVLVVEDEPLVALMMTELIRSLGAEVVGPFGSIGEASSARTGDIDVAVLDINVGGELVYPLAERLAARATPLLFLTGYDSKSVDPRFKGSNILTKPVDPSELARCLAGIVDRTSRQATLAT
jgi:CheY-like chemotaxis protein